MTGASRLPRRPAVTVTAVIPAMNEGRNVGYVIDRLPYIVTEVILVDGHSTDDTVTVARAARPDIRVVMQDGHGKGNALACGFATAREDIVVMLDADGSTDPREIPALIAPLLAGAEIVKGTRFARGGRSEDITKVRSAGNRVLLAIVNALYRTHYTDLCYGYAAFWRHAIDRLRIDCSGFEVDTLIAVRAARADLRVVEVPSVERSRRHGESNLRTFRDGRRVLRTIVRERVRRAPRKAAPVRDESEPRGGGSATTFARP
jgi:glycosyltransferase involved in cell wall biosynthesis